MKRWIELALVVLMSAAIFGGFALADAPTIIPRGFLRLDGSSVMTGVLVLPVGSQTAPSLAFSGDTNTGVFQNGADEVALTAGGTARLFAGTTYVTTPNILRLTNTSTAVTNVGSASPIVFDNRATAANVTATNGAFQLNWNVVGGANDLVIDFQVNAASVAGFDNEGDLFLDGDINSDVTTSSFDITSDTTAATMSTTVAAITLAPTATPDANDLVFEINSAAGTSLFTVDLEGDVFLLSDLNSDVTGSSFDITSDTTDATSTAATGTAPVGAITLRATADIATADALFSVEDSAGLELFTLAESGELFVASADQLTRAGFWSRTSAATMTTGASGVPAFQFSSLATPDADDLVFRFARGVGATNLLIIDTEGDTTITGNLDIVGTGSVTTCTLDGASPSVCTATVVASSTCVCANVGATAAIANNGCAVSLTSTTLTVTSANAATNVVNIHCL